MIFMAISFAEIEKYTIHKKECLSKTLLFSEINSKDGVQQNPKLELILALVITLLAIN